MYLYGFTTFAGIDKVMRFDSSEYNFSSGDLLKSEDEYFLVLGDQVSFAEQYNYPFPKSRNLELIMQGFFSEKYLDLLHWMVSEYYSTYKNVMKYFVGHDIEDLLKRESQKTSKSFKSMNIDPNMLGIPNVSDKGQTLVVYPDLWTMFMMINRSILDKDGVLTLNSSDTQVKKDRAFWQIKNGLVKYILVTHAELFQDFKNLGSIVLVHPYKWYYANQQDPRYKTPDVLSYLAKKYKINLIEV